MTNIQIFQLMGITLSSLGITWILDPKAMKETIKDMAGDRGTLLLSGISAVIFGYLILTFNNSWSSVSSAILTIFGWVGLVKGLTIIILPATGVKLSSVLSKFKKYYAVMPWLVFLVGVISLYYGCFA